MIVRVFLDANVIIPVTCNQYPLATYSAKVLSLASDVRFRVFTSPLVLAINHYFMEKKYGTLQAFNKTKMLHDKLLITENLKGHVADVLNNKSINDFEDGLQYYSASSANCNYIVTHDVKDFYFSKDIKVREPKQFLLECFA